MDLQESKGIWSKGWPDTQKTQHKFDSAEWLIAEVDRLTAENLQKESEVIEISEEVMSLRARASLWQARAEKAIAKLFEYSASSYKRGQMKMRARAALEADRIHGEASTCGDCIAQLELETQPRIGPSSGETYFDGLKWALTLTREFADRSRTQEERNSLVLLAQQIERHGDIKETP